MAAMTSTGVTCPVCSHTIAVGLSVAGQERADDGTVTLKLALELTPARESDRS